MKKILTALLTLALVVTCLVLPEQAQAATKKVGTSKMSSISLNKKDKPILKWKEVKNAAGYQVYRKTVNDADWVKIKTTKKAAFTDADFAATPQTEVSYKVRAYVKNGKKTVTGKFSNVVSYVPAAKNPLWVFNKYTDAEFMVVSALIEEKGIDYDTYGYYKFDDYSVSYEAGDTLEQYYSINGGKPNEITEIECKIPEAKLYKVIDSHNNVDYVLEKTLGRENQLTIIRIYNENINLDELAAYAAPVLYVNNK